MATKKPTAKQQKMIDHYIEHRSKVAAYSHAYNCENMLMKTVYRKSQAEFSKPHIKAICDKAIADISNKAQIDAQWVLQRSALLAGFNINKFLVFKDGMALYDFNQATDEDWYCISEITIDQIGESEDGLYLVDKVKLKAVDKLKALEQVGKHVSVQAFKEQIALAGVVTTVSMSPEEYKKARKEMMAEDDC